MSDGFQVCPQCEEEYTLAVARCAECGVALVSPAALAAAPEPEAFPEVGELECVRVGPLPWTRALSEALSSREIAHRVEPDTRSEAEGGVDPRRFGHEPVFGTWVRPGDRTMAAEIDRALFAHFEPDVAAESEGDDVCPACQEALPAQVLECPACGLAFG